MENSLKKKLLIILSIIGLILTVVPSILVFTQMITMTLNHQLMVAGMVLWFITAPGWMNKKEE